GRQAADLAATRPYYSATSPLIPAASRDLHRSTDWAMEHVEASARWSAPIAAGPMCAADRDKWRPAGPAAAAASRRSKVLSSRRKVDWRGGSRTIWATACLGGGPGGG